MSFFTIEQAPARLNRSELAVPGSQPKLFEKAAKSEADVIFLDLEDAVAPDDKEQARKNIIQAVGDIDWGRKQLSVRINGLDTHYMYRDVVDVVEQAGERLDLIMIPKVGTAADVYAVDMMVTQIEDAKGYKKRIGFEHIIETALGMQNVSEIAAASKRNESLHFGVADYAASTRARTTIIGGVNPDYSVLTDPLADGSRAVHWGDMWHYALARMVAQKMQDSWQQSVVVENKPGASGILAATSVQQAPADGYTVLFDTFPYVVNAVIHKLSFDPIKDLMPVSQAINMPLILVVPARPRSAQRYLLRAE